ncbi:MAG: methyltransferase regulatory domain-containing protein [Ilumatobacteraceae bacterium]
MTASSGFNLSYDEVPYPDLCYGLTHPGRLAAIGRLLNIKPVPAQACRVLEIGCAGGGNIVPMAFSLPDSKFVGIDLSERQIDDADTFSTMLRLTNIELHAMDVLDVTSEFGEFDYIIAHGVYSWVPQMVKDKVLSICHDHLSPTGIAYISYNTLPGWHMLSMVREMMLYHTRHITEPRARAKKARAVIKQFRSMISDVDQSVATLFLDAYVDTHFERFAGNADWEDSALLHDELSAINEPVYFHQFMQHAQQNNLQFLAEATFPQAMTHDLPIDTIAQLNEMAHDEIEFEQYLDYVRQQNFRRPENPQRGLATCNSLPGAAGRSLQACEQLTTQASRCREALDGSFRSLHPQQPTSRVPRLRPTSRGAPVRTSARQPSGAPAGA